MGIDQTVEEFLHGISSETQGKEETTLLNLSEEDATPSPVLSDALAWVEPNRLLDVRLVTLYPEDSFVAPSSLIANLIYVVRGGEEVSDEALLTTEWTENIYAQKFGFISWNKKPLVHGGSRIAILGSIKTAFVSNSSRSADIVLRWLKRHSNPNLEARFSFKPFVNFEVSRAQLLYACFLCLNKLRSGSSLKLDLKSDVMIFLSDLTVEVLMHLDCLETIHITSYGRKLASGNDPLPMKSIQARIDSLSDTHYAILLNRFFADLDSIGFHLRYESRLIPLLIMAEADKIRGYS